MVTIDEAQQYPELFRVLRGVIDKDRGAVGRYLLTGSSSPDIVTNLSESPVGRIATVELWPFKTVEFWDRPLPEIYRHISGNRADIQALFNLLATS
ncbi:AAA family ATPase [bacterium]|nr:AAA family ATPase [bacterium]